MNAPSSSSHLAQLADRQRSAFRELFGKKHACEEIESTASKRLDSFEAANRQKCDELQATAKAQLKKTDGAWATCAQMLARVKVDEPSRESAQLDVLQNRSAHLDKDLEHYVVAVPNKLVEVGNAVRALEEGRVSLANGRKRITVLVVVAALAGYTYYTYINVQQHKGLPQLDLPLKSQALSAQGDFKSASEWKGTIRTSMAVLNLDRPNPQGEWTGRVNYDGVVEELQVSLQSSTDMVMRGTSFRRINGAGVFSLDTFSGKVAPDGQTMLGTFVDASGNRGAWSLSRARPRPSPTNAGAN